MMLINNKQVISAGDKSTSSEFINFNWMLTDICNYKCAYCYAGYGHDTTRPVSRLKDHGIRFAWKSVLKRLSLNTITPFNIDIVGGEPVLHPDIIEILKITSRLPKLNRLHLTTNLSKPQEFYEKIQANDKLILNISYHFKYAKETMVEKIINLNKKYNVNVQIMLVDDHDYIGRVASLVNTLKSANICYTGLYLFSTRTYKTKYDEHITNEYDKLFFNQKKYKFITTESTEYRTEKDIIYNELNKFKGWSCSARSWEITTTGEIVNMCTRKPIDILLKDTEKHVTCPHTSCECTSFWDYIKYDNTNNRS